MTFESRSIVVVRLCMVLMLAACTTFAQSTHDVLTQHNDSGRTGASLGEDQLKPGNVNRAKFGFLFNLPVDGEIYAQPLYVNGLDMGQQGKHNVIVVATATNWVYAFDADTQANNPLWSCQLGTVGGLCPIDSNPRFPVDVVNVLQPQLQPSPTPTPSTGCHDIDKSVGIISTPVIDRGGNTLYVVSKTQDGLTPDRSFSQIKQEYWIHALDLVTGREKFGGPVKIQGAVNNVGFDATVQLNRTSLLFSQNRVYVGFGAHCDAGNYHGWVFGFDAHDLKHPPLVFLTTQNGKQGGIWQAGNGLAADSGGNIYFMTGNGDFNKDGMNFGTSFLKLSPGLTLADFFTPNIQKCLSFADIDLGSAGPLLLPGTNQLLGGGKEGKIYLLDRSNMGGYSVFPDADRVLFEFQGTENVEAPPDPTMWLTMKANLYAHSGTQLTCPLRGGPSDTIWPDHNGYSPHIHGSPVFWQTASSSYVYVWAEKDHLRQFEYDSVHKRLRLFNKSAEVVPHGMPGGILSISANGKGNGIVWAVHPYNPKGPANANAPAVNPDGILEAYDAANLNLLWTSDNSGDELGTLAKFTPPTIANGKVYVTTFDNRLKVYGPRDTTLKTCRRDLDCRLGLSCIFNVCEAPHGLGRVCQKKTDCQGALTVCYNGYCTQNVGPGGNCSDAQVCGPGLACDGGICGAPEPACKDNKKLTCPAWIGCGMKSGRCVWRIPGPNGHTIGAVCPEDCE